MTTEPQITQDGDDLIITIHGAATLPAGTHISLTVIVGGPQPEPAPEPAPEAPKRRYMNQRNSE
jgi:hypothetical protein